MLAPPYLASLRVLFEFSKQNNENVDASSGALVDFSARTGSCISSAGLRPASAIGNQQTVLHTAIVDHANIQTIKFLVETVKVDVNAREAGFNQAGPRGGGGGGSTTTFTGLSPLYVLVKHDVSGVGRDILKYLLSVKGIDFDIENPAEDHFTPLQYCIRHKKNELAEMLLDAGANPNYQSDARFNLRRTCLHLCAAFEEDSGYPTTKMLLKHGADPDLPESHGFTPLHVAVTYGKSSLIQILLQAKTKWGGIKNADPSTVDSVGHTARDFAIQRIKHKGDQFQAVAKLIPPSPNDTKQLPGEDKLPTAKEWAESFGAGAVKHFGAYRSMADEVRRRQEQEAAESDSSDD